MYKYSNINKPHLKQAGVFLKFKFKESCLSRRRIYSQYELRILNLGIHLESDINF